MCKYNIKIINKTGNTILKCFKTEFKILLKKKNILYEHEKSILFSIFFFSKKNSGYYNNTEHITATITRKWLDNQGLNSVIQ